MDFSEKFKTYSNADLLRIIENPNDYRAQAVEVAKNIFSDRNLSEMEIQTAKNELEIAKEEKIKIEQEKTAVENKVKSIFDRINPVSSKIPTTEKTIRIISILFLGFYLRQLYIDFDFWKFMFTSSYADWGLDMILHFLPLIAYPIGIVLFYQKKKLGWILFAIFFTLSAVSAVLYVIFAIIFDFYPLLTSRILIFAFFVGMIWIICREKIRTIYSISKRTAILTIIVTITFIGIGNIIVYLLQ